MLSAKVIIFALLLGLAAAHSKSHKIVAGSITDGHGIEEGREDNCRNGKDIRGFKLKSEDDMGDGDDTALNGVRFLCEDGGELDSLEGKWGSWGKTHRCRSGEYIQGIELQVESYGKSDSTGANNIRALCSDGHVIEGEGTRGWGKWRGMTNCGNDAYVCGFNSFVQEYRGSNDDMGMTGMRIACCRPHN